MSYKHSKKAGSVFDAFKHVILLKAAEIRQPKFYFETHCGYSTYRKPEKWDSSWVKVHRATGCRCFICDIDPLVEDSIPHLPEFQFYNGDGYKEVLNHTGYDMFFIDPPYVDPRDWINVYSTLKQLPNAIVWYPIFPEKMPGQIEAPQFIHEYDRFELLTASDKPLIGCGMLFKGYSKSEIDEIAKCRHFLAWSLSGIVRLLYGVV